MNPRLDLEHLAAYDFQGRNEADIRGDWIDPLLRLLGYGLGTRHDILRERSLALQPPLRMLGSSRLDLDFVPTVFGKRLWIIEAKRPQSGDDLFSDRHLGQAWSYATDPRIAVSLMLMCDGTRLGIFDVTRDEWNVPVFDCPKADLPQRWDELRGWIGAKEVAERVRQRQLSHLRTALEAQVDLNALDKTISDVNEIVTAARPIVMERREQIRLEARERLQVRGDAARDAVGIWGHAPHINGPRTTTMADLDRAVELVLRRPPIIRQREFDYFEKATTPKGRGGARMWPWLRAVRMGSAVLLSDAEGCDQHCRLAAQKAARDHATQFVDDPVEAAAYRLQRLLGPLGCRLAAREMPQIAAEANRIAQALDVEDWLRIDGEIGLTPERAYLRAAHFLPIQMLIRVDPWDVETLTSAADSVEAALPELPKPAHLAHLQDCGDPWLDSWIEGDPLGHLSLLMLRHIASRQVPGSSFARELLDQHYVDG